MSVRHRLALPLFAAGLAPWLAIAPAFAQTPWKEIGNWSITAFADSANCIAVTDWPDNTHMILAINAKSDQASLSFGKPEWISIRRAETYAIVLHLPPGAPLALTATGQEIGNEGALNVSAPADQLLPRLARAKTMDVEQDGKTIATMDLDNSSAMIKSLRDCARASDKSR